jgi:SAM-dependent methyltransferase
VTSSRPDLPSRALLEAQSSALAPMRSRIFRRIGIAHLGPVLELGAGTGAVTGELVRRSKGPVVALDRHAAALAGSAAHERVVADATLLPFEAGRFALVFAQCVFLWNDASARARILAEVRRVLAKDGVLVAIEPDWGAAMEHPAEIAIAPIACAALARAGADPRVGRKLPSELARAGFAVRIELVPEIEPPLGDRFAVLDDLELTEGERAELGRARAADARLADAERLVHVPYVFLTATPTPR